MYRSDKINNSFFIRNYVVQRQSYYIAFKILFAQERVSEWNSFPDYIIMERVFIILRGLILIVPRIWSCWTKETLNNFE